MDFGSVDFAKIKFCIATQKTFFETAQFLRLTDLHSLKIIFWKPRILFLFVKTFVKECCMNS